MEINPQQATAKITKFLQDTFKSQGFKKGIVAVSGGIDSAVSLMLAVKALGPENVYAFQLPYSGQSTADSDLIIQTANIPQSNKLKVDIKPAVDQLAGGLNVDNKLRLGNIMARIRMIHLFDQAKKLTALVIGTENKSERLLGYYTRFGDAASDIEPVSHLYKTEIKQLAEFLQLPGKIIQKNPSADLWSGQTDEKELGFSYQQADPILNLLVDQKLASPEVITKGFSKPLVDQIVNRLSTVDFKAKVPYHL